MLCSVVALIEDLRKINSISSIKDASGNEQNLRDQLGLMFTDWVRLFHHPSCTEFAQLKHVNLMISQGVLETEQVSSIFFRICTEQSVEIYEKAKASGGPPVFSFQAIDAYAKLIVLLVRQFNDGSQLLSAAKAKLGAKAISIIMLVLVNLHNQQRGNFNQRPLFRILVSLLHEMSVQKKVLGPAYAHMICSIRCVACFRQLYSNTLHAVNPVVLPGFSFAWMQIISHRSFLPNILEIDQQMVRYFAMFHAP